MKVNLFIIIINLACLVGCQSSTPKYTERDLATTEKVMVEEFSETEKIPTDTTEILPDTTSTLTQTTTEKQSFNWNAPQDSFRNALLAQCENEILKTSFLQEFYIRKVVKPKNNRIYFEIQFDVHGNDCGAPDCYVTTVKFDWELGDSLIFPETFNFSEQESGCSSNPYFIKNQFHLVESTSRYVLYHCPEKKRTLLMYGAASEERDALYFLHYNLDEVDPKHPMKRYEKLLEQNKHIYVSHALTSCEYQLFFPQ